MISQDGSLFGNALWLVIAAFPVLVFILLIFVAAHNIKMNMVSRLRYTREFSEHDVIEGDEIYIIETIYNPTLIPFFFLDIASYIDGKLLVEGHSSSEGMQLIISRFHLLPFEKITRKYKVKCRRRGYYKMESAALLHKKTTLEYSKTFSVDSEVYVYPKTEPYAYTAISRNFVLGDEPSSNKCVFDPFSIIGIRDYVFGDPFNTINFKATAKSAYQGAGCIKINKFDNNSERVFMVFLNFQRRGDIVDTAEYERQMERAISVCARFVTDAAESGHKVGFAANCRAQGGENKIVFPVLGGHFHAREMMRAMASLRIDHASSFLALVESGMTRELSTAEVFVISPCIDESVDAAVRMLKLRNSVEVVRL